jgi:hypothetical protein
MPEDRASTRDACSVITKDIWAPSGAHFRKIFFSEIVGQVVGIINRKAKEREMKMEYKDISSEFEIEIIESDIKIEQDEYFDILEPINGFGW